MAPYFYFDVRQQFIIPTSPVATWPASAWSGMQNQGTDYASNTDEDGDSYYTTLWVLPSNGTVNMRIMVDTAQLPDQGDYFVCTVETTAIANELVIQVTKFAALVPYPSWRLRINRLHFPYQAIQIAGLSFEGDITQVSFSETPDWIATPFGTPPTGRQYFFVKLTGWPTVPVHKLFPILTNNISELIGPEQLRL